MPGTVVAKHSVEPSAARYDDRAGLGYGIIKKGFHHPRSAQGAYPYKTDDAEESFQELEFDDIDSKEAIPKKVLDLYVNDPMAGAAADPFYFAGGNTKLADCFFRPDVVLKEIAVLANTMSPIPKSRRASSRLAGGGASFPAGVKSRPRTGSGKGYASAPPMSKIEAQLAYDEEDSEEEKYSLEDFALSNSK